MNTPETFAANSILSHGACGRIVMFNGQRYYYGCTDSDDDIQGYIEVLEFNQPPADRPKVVVFVHTSKHGDVTVGFTSVELAKEQAHEVWYRVTHNRDLRGIPGMLQQVSGQPWFYQAPT